MADASELFAEVTHAFNQRAWPRAQAAAMKLLAIAPRHALANYIAGIASMELQQLAPALDCLRRATMIDPERADFAVHFAKALSLARRNGEAKTAADRARSRSAGNPAMLDTLGVIYSQVGDHEVAAEVFREATRLAPRHAPFHYNLATSLIAAGRIADAESELETSVALDERHWMAHLSLAQVRRQTTDHNHLLRLESLLRRADLADIGNEARMCLHMALAKEHEDLAQYASSFQHLLRGKAAGAALRHYAFHDDEALFAAITAAFPAPARPAAGCASTEPIFVIGMPRSGTTLVERILSSHPDVQAAGELLNFGLALKHLSGCPTQALVDAQTIRAAGEPDWRKLGETYLASTRPGTGSTRRFIDKLPHNFLYAGYIATALPNAKIVCLRRDPLDTCLSNFRQLFAPKSPFFDYSFDLLDTGRYFVLFDRLMAHWRTVFPGRILELQYESIVDAQEASTRTLLEHCGLSWNDACLQFERNPTPVATASAVQVRAPLNRGSIGRWQYYAAELGELREVLRSSGVEMIG
jgi:tetratricopeptide (TPR) repeat protein